MGCSPPWLPGTPLTASGSQVHLSAALVHSAGLDDQEDEPTRPRLQRKCMTLDL
jgi:hypothetical protein